MAVALWMRLGSSFRFQSSKNPVIVALALGRPAMTFYARNFRIAEHAMPPRQLHRSLLWTDVLFSKQLQ